MRLVSSTQFNFGNQAANVLSCLWGCFLHNRKRTWCPFKESITKKKSITFYLGRGGVSREKCKSHLVCLCSSPILENLGFLMVRRNNKFCEGNISTINSGRQGNVERQGTGGWKELGPNPVSSPVRFLIWKLWPAHLIPWVALIKVEIVIGNAL